MAKHRDDVQFGPLGVAYYRCAFKLQLLRGARLSKIASAPNLVTTTLHQFPVPTLTPQPVVNGFEMDAMTQPVPVVEKPNASVAVAVAAVPGQTLEARCSPDVSLPREVLFHAAYGCTRLSSQFCEFSASRGLCIPYGSWSGMRGDPRLIALVKEFGLEKSAAARPGQTLLPGQTPLAIATVPAYYNYSIHEYDGMEDVIPEFPWETLARALLSGRTDDTTLLVVKSGKLALPYDS